MGDFYFEQFRNSLTRKYFFSVADHMLVGAIAYDRMREPTDCMLQVLLRLQPHALVACISTGNKLFEVENYSWFLSLIVLRNEMDANPSFSLACLYRSDPIYSLCASDLMTASQTVNNNFIKEQKQLMKVTFCFLLLFCIFKSSFRFACLNITHIFRFMFNLINV